MMNTSAIWVAGLAVSLVALWAVFAYLVPSWLCSAFRYRLWGLRDNLQDDIIHGRLPDQDFVRELVSMVETVILFAERFTLLRVLVTPANRKASDVWATKVSAAQLPAEQKAVVLDYRHKLLRLVVFKVIFGSLSGWVLLVTSFPIAVVLCIVDVAKKANVSLNLMAWDMVNRAWHVLKRTWKNPDPIGIVLAIGSDTPSKMALTACA